ncbi:RagB/SusD family nutrient uptake outer membrane protein [Puteibacter caeruleilacunae]|nr:RagB/SusD family nutrient uptake outer membrane protein [Puteibacter caeruleilacunae]
MKIMRLRNIFKSIILSVAGFGGITSCNDYFEEPITSDITMEVVFFDTLKAKGMLNSAYSVLPFMFPTSSGTSEAGYLDNSRLHQHILAHVSDEAISARNIGGFQLFVENAISPLIVGKNGGNVTRLEHTYEEPYYFFRKAFLYLENVNSIPDAPESFVKRTSAEAKMLIAVGYLELMMRYGSVPYMDHAIAAGEQVDATRMPLAEFVDKVDALILEAREDLPVRWTDDNIGRVTKATAYFLRSRLWLWAASPIFNKPSADYGSPSFAESVGVPEVNMGTSYNADLWKKAADMAKEAIDFCESNGYALVNTGNPIEDYTLATRDLIGTTPNTEVIQISRRTGLVHGNSIFNKRHLPPREGNVSKSTSSCCITQNFVDLYETVDGSTPDYETDNPWVNLDPRFHASVVHDRAKFGAGTIGMMKKNSDPKFKNIDKYNDWWTTGYVLRKFLHPEHWLKANAKVQFDLVSMYMRLPELYFSYAEALNEYSPGHADILIYLNKTRERAQMPDITAGSQDEMREKIHREKAVEMAFEDQRYFDCKRWLQGSIITQKKMGAQRRKGGGGYDIAECMATKQYANYEFLSKYYLWPFPVDEIMKDIGLVQNPGYN